MSSDLSFAGSCEHDLIKSKVWLCQKLPRRRYRRIYVLGSWYGNFGLILRGINFPFNHIINIESNKAYCSANKKIYQFVDFDIPYTIINNDCNKVQYKDPDLIVNTSTNDIKGHNWFNNIPSGCLVAVQCRNNQSGNGQKNRPNSFNQFGKMFTFKKVIYKGKLNLQNNEEQYQRYTIIGIK